MTIIKKEIINAGDEDQMTLSGYKRKQYSQILVKLGYLFTLGLMKLLFDLYPTLMVKCLCVKCNLEEADYVKLEDQYHQIYIEVVCCVLVNRNSMEIDLASKTNSCNTHDTGIEVDNSQQTVKDDKIQHKYFINKKIKYVWNEKLKCFEKLKGLHYGKSCSYFHECQGLTKSQQSERQLVYSSNAIKVSVTPILKLLYTQGLNPFYLFQAFSCTLWFIDMYYYFAGCILFLSVISLIIQIRQTRMTERKLKNTIGVPETVNVFRSDTQGYERISSEDLVPGDIIEIPQYGSIMQCDAVLLNGTCIVNESMLTGESVPVTKTSIPDPHHSTVPTKEVVFNDKDHVQHVLFCGTKIIQTRFYEQQKVTAVVMHTSFMTAKGELIRSILFPKPVSFKFTQDSYKFIACLALVAGIGMIYTLALMISRGETAKRVIVRTLDLITIVIPPALPAAMTVGIVMAQKRLWKSAIYCISPRNINLCGALDCFCFDKTGTLTEDGLDLKLVVPSTLARFQDEVHDIRSFSDTSLIIIAMATCHSLTLINNELAGDPLDLKMFEAIQWDFIEPGEDNSKYDNFAPTIVRPRNQATPLISSNANTSPQPQNIIEYGILRQFTFASKLQRMSVIVRRLGGSSFELFCKGSPEMVASLSLPESVPSNFQDTLMMYTRQGFRVLALAHRQLRMKIVKIQRCEREHVECKMTFLGLIVFENQLKMQTQPVIHILKNANIRSIMVTGDNMLTALSVAENCEMINKHDNIIFITSLPPEDPGDGDGDEDNKYEIHWAHVKDNRPSIHLSNYEGSSEQRKHEEHLSPHHEIGKLHLAVTGKAWALIKKNNPQIIHQKRGSSYVET